MKNESYFKLSHFRSFYLYKNLSEEEDRTPLDLTKNVFARFLIN